ncbi:hypothetical protein KC332_g2715 [Hortaea werneckii]|nr:hypothetical protein KC358_g1902 [Hortaea werneckii]OTA33997.1 hypothetical protein BTJ68_05541 [Hortaea werneckii EXF-2000]KAI6852230.1 hypothetical protein KC350_g1078 [Hortaea werneckii]KAI6934335.1 hypothetical protein KC341_g7679 [Hortaea werneckii]KAI6948902.1 hypothetical protein KC348_g1692 [Hortaea werneckii]
MPLTDEDAALQAISTLDPLTKEQHEAKEKIDAILSTEDPFIDIHELFALYNILYFRSLLLPRVEVSWSNRLTLCAGICELVRDPDNGNKYSRIRLKLSEPLLKYRPRGDVINTLLHEAIHSYFFITTSWRHSRGDDGTGHGAGFLLLADAVNNHGGYQVTVYHTFHDEVDSYRTHIWQCDGACRSQAPFFGLVKRSMNRAPAKTDTWWGRHQDECGGAFVKIAEPELSKDQVERLSGLKRAGRQKNKIDAWVGGRRETKAERTSPTQKVEELNEPQKRRAESPPCPPAKRPKAGVSCPICEADVVEDLINEHLDVQHPP